MDEWMGRRVDDKREWCVDQEMVHERTGKQDGKGAEDSRGWCGDLNRWAKDHTWPTGETRVRPGQGLGGSQEQPTLLQVPGQSTQGLGCVPLWAFIPQLGCSLSRVPTAPQGCLSPWGPAGHFPLHLQPGFCL